MLYDFHFHTDFSADSTTPACTQIQKAISLGMSRICITDHHDMDVVSPLDFTLNLPEYVSALARLRDEYQDRIRIEIGIELGLQCHIQNQLHDIACQYPFDYIIGSCHFIDGLDPYYPEYFEGKTEKEAYSHFFEVTLKRIETIDSFDSLGHLDYVVRYGPHKNRSYQYEDHKDLIDQILKTLIQKGKALECNTGGFRYGLGHPNPCEDILRRYRQIGGELLTVGSDAHTPEYLGFEFGRTAELLKSCGFTYYTVYHKRKPEFLRL